MLPLSAIAPSAVRVLSKPDRVPRLAPCRTTPFYCLIASVRNVCLRHNIRGSDIVRLICWMSAVKGISEDRMPIPQYSIFNLLSSRFLACTSESAWAYIVRGYQRRDRSETGDILVNRVQNIRRGI